MTPMQQILLGTGAKKKTYLDEVFSTDLWIGNGSARTITNNIDVSGEGALVWIKNRGSGENHVLSDTVRGANKQIRSNNHYSEVTTSTSITAFTSSGYSIGTDDNIAQNDDGVGWTFRKAPGFFDVVTYTGNGSTQNISHSLGSIPGMIIVKCTSANENWCVYHRTTTATKRLLLNLDWAASSSSSAWNSTEPTASVFTVGNNDMVNNNGESYVAYIFGGGASDAATARSIELDGSNDYFQTSASTDFEFTGDFTFECWFNPQSVSGSRGIFNLGISSQEGGFEVYMGNQTLKVVDAGVTKITTTNLIDMDQWYHIAFVRSGTKNTLYLNGIDVGNYTTSNDYGINSGGNRSYFMMGTGYSGAVEHYFDGHISNVRVLNGTALYTASFRPPTEPLTNITNTKLLCCNNSSVTGSTVAPTTLTASGTVASAKHPFDDPAAFTFGDSKEGIVKCGSYTGRGSAGLQVYLGWEPQFILHKRTDAQRDWVMFDTMRGLAAGGNDSEIWPNTAGAESANTDRIDLTSTGFTVESTSSGFNLNGGQYSYIAIRRPDGYVSKPIEDATKCFAMDTGAGSSSIPNFDSGFPVDFAIAKKPAAAQDWYTNARLTGIGYLVVNSSQNETDSNSSEWVTDSNIGWNAGTTYNSDYHSWMWKRHAGFDVVTYEGHPDSQAMTIQHSLNKIPEMMWIKRRTDAGYSWLVYHKGLNGGTNPHQYFMMLDSSSAESNVTFFPSAPTSTSIRLSGAAAVNNADKNYLMMLFSSISGVSKVGSYTGTGSSFSVDCGFQPRFLVIKRADSAGGWRVFDTSRGWTSSDNNMLLFDTNGTEDSGNYVNHNSTGFTLTTSADVNASSGKFIYYAHA